MANRLYLRGLRGLTGTALLLMLYAGTGAFAQKPASSLSSGDISFLKDAARSGLEEVRLGEMAERVSTNDRIRYHGRKLVEDRTTVDQDFRRLAEKDHVVLPKDLSSREEADNQTLSELRGRSFDTTYLETTIRNHKNDLAAFQKEAAQGIDPGLKNLASRSISVIEEHLRYSEAIAQDMGMPIDPE